MTEQEFVGLKKIILSNYGKEAEGELEVYCNLKECHFNMPCENVRKFKRNL